MLLRPPRAVLAAAALAVGDAGSVEGATDDVVPDAGKVLYAAATNQDDRVLLEAVAFTRDVSSHFHRVRQTNASDLAEGRVWLLRCHRPDLDANAALLRAALAPLGAVVKGVVTPAQRRRLRLPSWVCATAT